VNEHTAKMPARARPVPLSRTLDSAGAERECDCVKTRALQHNAERESDFVENSTILKTGTPRYDRAPTMQALLIILRGLYCIETRQSVGWGLDTKEENSTQRRAEREPSTDTEEENSTKLYSF